MLNILELTKNYSGFVASISAFGGIVWTALKFWEHLRHRRFEIYHGLIDRLVNENTKENPGGVIKLDRQIAIIYELRNFPTYYPVTRRILTGLSRQWTEPRIIAEIDHALDFISKNFITRWWRQRLKSS